MISTLDLLLVAVGILGVAIGFGAISLLDITVGALRRATGFPLDEIVGHVIRRQVDFGFLEDTGTHIRLTREGRFVADSVIAEFL